MSTLVTIQAADLITNSRADINGNFAALNTDKIETSVIDTDTTLAANSDSKLATQKAVKAYVDALGNLTTKTSGVSTGPASSSTQTVTHSLSRVPTVLRVTGYGLVKGSGSSQSSGSTTGTYTSSGNRCVYTAASVTAADGAIATSTTYAVYLSGLTAAGTEVHASGVIQNITSTTFDIVWTASADTSSATAFIWEAN